MSGVVSASVYIHQSVERTSATFFAELRRAAYVTPTSYLELLKTFSKLLDERRESIGKTRGRLAVGLDKLASTAVAVEGMQKELKDLQPVLEKTAVEVEDMMVQIDADKAAAAETKAAVQQQEAAANEKAAQAKAIADDAQVYPDPSCNLFIPQQCVELSISREAKLSAVLQWCRLGTLSSAHTLNSPFWPSCAAEYIVSLIHAQLCRLTSTRLFQRSMKLFSH